MAHNVVLVGSFTDSELHLLQRVCAQRNLNLIVCKGHGDLEKRDNAVGYISSLPCTEENILKLFASQPIGFGELIPFFQKIDSDDNIPDFVNKLPVSGLFKSPLGEAAVYNMAVAIDNCIDTIKRHKQFKQDISKYRNQKHLLVQIGTALSNENDLVRLLELILSVSREVTGADAGSIYTCEKMQIDGVEKPALRFRVSQNDSVDINPGSEFVFPISARSISGYVAMTGEPLLIDNVASLDNTVPYSQGKDFAKKFGYRVKSMLTVPLKNMEAEVVGILQLMNKKYDLRQSLADFKDVENAAYPFSIEDEDIILSIASYAAVSIERVMLYDNIRKIFEGFLGSSIAAIDERDSVTSGHSKRVEGYAMAFVEAAAQMKEETIFSKLASSQERVRQFKFAALLHDIGKIGVPEDVLTKNLRLSPGLYSALMAKFDYIRLLMRFSDLDLPWKSEQELDNDIELIKKINHAGFLSDEDYQKLSVIRNVNYTTLDGVEHQLLSPQEWGCLSVRKGNLTAQEREMINSHALSTYRILSKIPWTNSMKEIPFIACHHHEKMNGTGYPHGLKGDQIPLESRILAVVDIYEALVAQDRPYKPKMEHQKALNILKSEVECGHLDPDVLDFFIENEIYKLYLDPDDELNCK